MRASVDPSLPEDMSNRSLIYAANWKMHHGPAAARISWRASFRSPLRSAAGSCGSSLRRSPSPRPRRRPPGAPMSLVGAQNVHWEPKGAFTGELSIPLVQEAGARAVLIGHSERRHLFGETDEQVARKLAAALKAGMSPMVCVGETLAEREGGRTEQVVTRQVSRLPRAGRRRPSGGVSCWPTSRSGPSAPGRTPPRTTPPRSTS